MALRARGYHAPIHSRGIYGELDMKEFGILNNLKNLIKCFRNKVWSGSGHDLQYPNIIL